MVPNIGDSGPVDVCRHCRWSCEIRYHVCLRRLTGEVPAAPPCEQVRATHGVCHVALRFQRRPFLTPCCGCSGPTEWRPRRPAFPFHGTRTSLPPTALTVGIASRRQRPPGHALTVLSPAVYRVSDEPFSRRPSPSFSCRKRIGAGTDDGSGRISRQRGRPERFAVVSPGRRTRRDWCALLVVCVG